MVTKKSVLTDVSIASRGKKKHQLINQYVGHAPLQRSTDYISLIERLQALNNKMFSSAPSSHLDID